MARTAGERGRAAGTINRAPRMRRGLVGKTAFEQRGRGGVHQSALFEGSKRFEGASRAATFL